MTKKINIYEIVSFISFYSILFVILLLTWAINLSPKLIIIISSLILFVLNLKTKFKFDKWLIGLIILFVYVVINVTFTVEHPYFYDAFINYTVAPFFSIIYISLILKNKESFLRRRIYNPLFFILNIYYIINFFIILKQISTPWFMVHNFTNNTLYLDHITGLIGSNGTAKLMIFNIICSLMNFSHINDQNKIMRNTARVCLVAVTIMSLYVSLYNDSRFFYVLLPLFFMPVIISFYSDALKHNLKKILITIIVILSAFVLYLTNDTINNLVTEKFVNNYISRTSEKFSSQNGQISEERVVLLRRAIEEGNGFAIGKGIGSIPGNGGSFIKHFGLNDFNVRIYSGGIIYALIIAVMYSSSLMVISFNSKEKKSTKYYLLIVLIILGCYSNFFTYCDKSFLLGLLFLMYRLIFTKEDKDLVIR